MKAHEKALIDMIAPIVVRKCKEHGWGIPSAIIGQACVESVKENSLSGLATTCFNYFGMKWTSGCGVEYKQYTATEQRPDGSYYQVPGTKWRKYNSVEEGIEGYFKFIESYKRYKPVMAAKDYKEYATQIRLCGWATSLSYQNSILSRIQANGLRVYDGADIVPTTPTEEYIIGKTYVTTSDVYIRDDADGSKVKYDHITPNAKANSFFDEYGYAILKKGSKVTVKAVKKLPKSTWVQIPSGWIIAYNMTNKYVI